MRPSVMVLAVAATAIPVVAAGALADTWTSAPRVHRPTGGLPVPRGPAGPTRGSTARGRVIGCRARAPWYRERGPSRGRRIALTFDGGPTKFTPAIVHILHHLRVHSTFFIRGGFVSGRERLLREERRYGAELANHSFTHPHFPGHAELARTSGLIHHVSGFWPCLFRAPYGDVNASLIDSAHRLGMVTVQWDVDTLDGFDAATSTQTILERVARLARPGSIVLMHDGDGYHRPTIEALPRLIRMLRSRGYHLVTVSQLLGLGPRVVGGRAAGAGGVR